MDMMKRAIDRAVNEYGIDREKVQKLKELLEEIDGTYEEFASCAIMDVTENEDWVDDTIAFLEEYDGNDTDDVEIFIGKLVGDLEPDD